ncbi:MAG: hypothetical protein GDA50_04185 [Alphaproteobacteria bacterium GM202ARS2]|nr:hypothetical protein [Alphaproteobacteria bacterium GM202ARS2]
MANQETTSQATGQSNALPPLNIPPEAFGLDSNSESNRSAAPDQAAPTGDGQTTTEAGNPDETEQQSTHIEPNADGDGGNTSETSAESGEGDGQETSETQPKKPKRNRITERIQQLNTQRWDAVREARAANERAERAETALERLQERMSQAPEIDDDDYEGQQAYRTRQMLHEDRMEAAQEERDQAIEERNAAIEREQEARNQAFMTKLEDASDRFPDLIRDFRDVPVSDVGAEFIADSDNAAEIAHWLTANRTEARRIATLPQSAQLSALARLEVRITEAPQARKVSQAPPPPPKVKGTASPQIKDPNDPSLSFEEYRAIRRAEIEAEKKRS